jgi:hypothetical protein
MIEGRLEKHWAPGGSVIHDVPKQEAERPGVVDRRRGAVGRKHVRGELSTAQGRVNPVLTPLNSPAKHVGELRQVVVSPCSRRKAQSCFDDIVDITESDRIALRPIFIGIQNRRCSEA